MIQSHLNPFRPTALHAALLVGAGLLLLAPGCGRRQPIGGELIRPESEPRATDRILLAQTVAGAGEDRMLYPHHFDGDMLNSLGNAKLRLMLEDAGFLADPEIFVVSGQEAHLAAVRRYLSDWGVAFDETRLQSGINPRTRRPAALGLEQLQRFEERETGGEQGGGTTQQVR